MLAIFLTAPLGGIAISLLGPVLLTKEVANEAEDAHSNEAHSDGSPVEFLERDNRKCKDSTSLCT